MRIFTALLLTSCVLTAGCEWMKKNKNINNVDTPPKDLGQSAPTSASLVSYLNKQADKMSVLETNDISIVTHVQGRRMPGLTGFMVCEKPRNFRLQGDAVSTTYVDIGSNNDQFWFWVKDGEAPLYYCNYSDYDRGTKLPLPFQPEWVVQALGMAKFDPNGKYRVEQKGNTYELIEDTMLQGQPARKITVFNARNVTEEQPQVMAHIVQDSRTGKIICQATIKRMRSTDYRNEQGAGRAFYPAEVMLEWPSEQLSMTMKIGRATVNHKMSNAEASRYFTLPNWTGLKRIDLAQMRPGSPTGREINPAGGFR
jgi:hypothetical protein